MMDSGKRYGLSPLWAGGAALVLWILSGFFEIDSIAVVILVVLSATAVRSSLVYERNGKGYRFEMGYKDWLGLAVLIAVVIALLKGTKPEDIIRLLTKSSGE